MGAVEALRAVEAAIDELFAARTSRPLDAARALCALLPLADRLETLTRRRRLLEQAARLSGGSAPPASEHAESARAELADAARAALRRCGSCCFLLAGLRSDARFCSDRCRARAFRRRHGKET